MKKKYFLPIFLFVQIILIKVLALFPEFVEQFYSNGLYFYISKFSRIALGWVSFSVGDLCYTILIFFVLRWIYKNRIGFFANWKNNGLTILSFVSVLYFLFHFLWGINYYRVPLHEKMGIEKEYTKVQLQALTEKLIAKTNQLQFQIEKDSTKKVVFSYSEQKMYEMAPRAYASLPKPLVFIKYQNESIKSSLYSLSLSYMGFGGYLNPFTNEAQVNYLKPKYTSPLTICHEMAHQTGIASESDCNFVGFMAASSHKDLYFQYSAYAFALNYCIYNLEVMEEGSAKSYRKLINKGVLENFNENKTFWKHYHSWIDTFFEYFYDKFLKFNQQKDGMESYSKFVGLLINYDLKHQVIHAN
ncbi:MAG: amino acid permease [Flavobacteria bacterium RIFCSPLOWO2_12_FULL_31_7]|nr:MAG: amino acid permease [Flavobacteria bacterium RIFCSPLOWO2_12_FULL_31_7]